MRFVAAFICFATAPLFIAHVRADDAPAPNPPASAAAPEGKPEEPTAEASAKATAEPTAEADAQLVSGTRSAEAASPKSSDAAAADAAAQKLPSAAERIARLERSLEDDQKRLQDLNTTLGAPDSEFAQAESQFRELDTQRNELQQQAAQLEKADKQAELEQLRAQAAMLETKWTLAKERFDLAIRERKEMQQSVGTLSKKLDNDRATLSKLKDAGQPQPLATQPAPETPPAQAAAEPTAPPMPANEPPPAAARPVSPPAPAPVAQAPAESPPAAAPPAAPPAAQPAQEAPAQPAQPAPKLEIAPPLSAKISRELEVAREAAKKSQAAAKAAEDEAQTITDRIEILQNDIGHQRKLRDTARQKVDNFEKTLYSLNDELFRKLMAGENVDGIRDQIKDATSRLHDSRIQSRTLATRLDELQSQLADLQSEKMTAMHLAAEKREAAERAQATVEKLKNPFTVRNLLQWLIDHGPRILVILVSLCVFVWLSRVLESRLVDLTAKRGRRGSREERENRAKTLLGVFRNVANIAIVAGGIMMILDEVGVPVAPVIGGAAVFGLAVAFGAQSLIKDYFVGFMVLLEQQYLVNDVIAIGDIKGQVERISLRITVLRDLEGRVHFIPHNQINTVTNMTHGWSRAVFEIGVAYKESVDRVIEVLNSLAHELRRDDNYKLLILSDPVMLGVDAFDNSAVVIKFYIQTRPLQQWTVKREMLRRIKNEFDRLGIEIPFPHLTVYRGAGHATQQSDEHFGQSDDRDAA